MISHRSFIVSGGASGLGAATVRMLVAQGAKVVIADVQRATGEALAAELGSGCQFVECDVADEAAVRSAVEAATKLAPLGGAVACAGIAPAARIVGRDGPHDLALFERVVRINLVGSFNLLRWTAHALSQQPLAVAPASQASASQVNGNAADGERGVIVLTASVAAEEGQIGQAAYAASKGGIAALTLPAARELARFGIRVVTIAPGIFETPLTAAMTDEVRKSLAANIPFPARLGSADEYAALVRQILENPYLNGTMIRLDAAARLTSK